MTTVERLRLQRDLDNNEPLEQWMLGAASDDVARYTPLATGVISELASGALKSKEEAAKKKAYEASDAGQAAKAARDTRLKAQLAAADAMGESDPSGPKHKVAADLEGQARSAEARAAVYGVPMGLPQTPGEAPRGGESFFSQYKWPLIGAGAFGLIVVALLARRK